MNPLDIENKSLVFNISHTLAALLPCVIAAPAHLLHSIYGAVFINELIFHQGCLEKMANAFFNMSRSSVTSANDLFNFRISSSSGFMRPLPGNASSVSPKYSRFHRCITLGWISRSRATSETFRSLSVTKQATSLFLVFHCTHPSPSFFVSNFSVCPSLWEKFTFGEAFFAVFME